MVGYFRSVAVDYDGTLTTTARPEARVLNTLQKIRRSGLKVLLSTGRILSELRADFADVDEHFDAIVCENGGVLVLPNSNPKPLAPPVSKVLEARLRTKGVALRRGQVLLAGHVKDDGVITSEIGTLGLDCQILRNRNELMILPAGVSKGSGSLDAHAELGISYHNCIAIGDAENDHSLLERCEVSVAVSNAIGPLKEHADVVLDEPNGHGVSAFLSSDFSKLGSQRWHLELGRLPGGTSVRIPAARINLLITGPSRSGKSYLVGMLAERLLSMGYNFCLFDFEGDHIRLGNLRGVVTLGGNQPLPSTTTLRRLIGHRFSSLIVDLSLVDEGTKQQYALESLSALRQLREETGLPHWLIVEESHLIDNDDLGVMADCLAQTGVCRITYRPSDLDSERRLSTIIQMTSEGYATVDGNGSDPQRRFVPGCRATPHVRHLHKYEEAQLPQERHFIFRDHQAPTGRSAGNLFEFVAEIRCANSDVLRHHASHRDFSRWISGVFQEKKLAEELRRIEEMASSIVSPDVVRHRIIQVVEAQYPQSNP